MARRTRRGGRARRGSNRGNRQGLLVRERPYAIPLPEPANFIEKSIGLLLTTAGSVTNLLAGYITFDNIFASIGQQIPQNVQKFRVTSVVIEPVAAIQGSLATGQSGAYAQLPVGIMPLEVDMMISGNHWLQSDRNKPLHMRFGKYWGDDGMWLPGTNYNNVVNNNFNAGGNFMQVSVYMPANAGTSVSQYSSMAVDVKVRIAWTDVANT